MFKQKHTVAQALRPLHLLRSQISSHETSLDRRPPRAPRFISAENISIVVTWACFGQLPFFQRSVTAIATSQRRAKIRIWNLNTLWYFQWFISIKNQRTSPIKVSSIDLMRAECHDRLSIANGCSRDVVLSHVSAIQKHVFHPKSIPKKKERTLDFNRYKLPQRYWNSFFKNERLGILSQKMLFPPCKVVVDFFFDEEERRYAITRRQRKEHKKGEKLARASQNSPYSNPLCPFFPKSVFSFICHFTFPRYKNHFVSLQEKKRKKKAKWWMKRAAHSRNARTANRRESRDAVFFFFFTRARVRKEENARKKHLSIFSLSLEIQNLRTSFVFFFFVPTETKGMVKE